MSIIALKGQQDNISPASILKLSKILSVPSSTVLANMMDGEPIAIFELFQNDHVTVGQQLRAIMAIDDADRLRLSYFELQPEDRFGPSTQGDRISVAALESILGTADGEFL